MSLSAYLRLDNLIFFMFISFPAIILLVQKFCSYLNE